MAALEDAAKIMHGVAIIASKNPTATLCALDKNLYCGPGGRGQLTPEQLNSLKELGWEWDAEQDAWGFYTGHG
jgi:hypothetical protein